MTFLLFIIVWYAIGCLGSLIAMEFYWRRGKYPLDVNVRDLIFFAIMSMTGPINLIVGIILPLGSFVLRHIDGDKVIFRKKSND